VILMQVAVGGGGGVVGAERAERREMVVGTLASLRLECAAVCWRRLVAMC